MSYYSEVAICCGKNVFEELNRVFKKRSDSRGFPDSVRKQYEEYLLYWEAIQWDDTIFPVIKEIEAVLKKFSSPEIEDNECEDDGYFFIRVGENPGDYETQTNDISDMELTPFMSIDLDFASDWNKISLPIPSSTN